MATASEPHLEMLKVYRYPKPASSEPSIDGVPNLFHLTHLAGAPRVMLESGINRVAFVGHGSERRRPAILVRSSPGKAGSESTPWHDVFDLDNGHVR